MMSFKVGRVTGYKRSDSSRWSLYWRMDGKRHRRTVETVKRDTAEGVAMSIWNAIRSGDYLAIDRALKLPVLNEVTFGDLLDAFEIACPIEYSSNPRPSLALSPFSTGFDSWRPSTWRGNLSIRRRLRDRWGNELVRAFTPTMIDRFLQQQEHMSCGRTRNNYLGTLNTILKWAEQHSLIAELPSLGIRWKRVEEHVPEALQPEELALLYNELRPVEKRAVMLLHDTGLRMSEMTSLTWEDLNLRDGLITVRDSKSLRSFRSLPLTVRSIAMLSEFSGRANSSQPLMLYPFNERTFRSELAKASRRAGIRHVHPHLFRHTYATELVDEGVPLETIQKLLGHRSITMTQRYAKKRAKGLHEAVAKLRR